MKKNYLLGFIVFFLCCHSVSYSQIFGADVFLQGRWLEIGEDVMGAFGTCSSPAGYHAHPTCYCSTTCTTTGAELDAAFDWGHDGWATGVPCMMGNYTIPGYPQEGWGIQVGATEYRNWAGGGTCTGSFNIPGGVTSYSNTGGSARSIWTGNIVGLHIVQETRVDTEASWVVVTARIYNTTGAAITGVYYERTCDPDNASGWGGGSATENVIVHQNEDARHDVMIGTYANSGMFNRYNSYLGLATKDCRAKCMVVPSLYPTTTPSSLWSGVGGGTVITALGDSNYADEGIALVFNIGTIASLDSAVVSYAYVYNGHTGIDSAFPDPRLLVEGVPAPYPVSPGPTYDTINVCANPTDTLHVHLKFADDKCWTWSGWTWSPSVGLSSTTGVTVAIGTRALPPMLTYTITGTDSAAHMFSCNHRMMYLTIITCNNTLNNSPCYGDTLKLTRKGDSTGRIYAWHGPGGFTSTKQNPVKYPATYADSGMFYVIRTFLGVSDTDSTYVTIHEKPVITATNNSPLCAGMIDTLNLSVTPSMPGETFSWTGPNLFVSGLQFPVINPFTLGNVGVYTVVATTTFGCKDTAFTSASFIEQPPAPLIITQTYCQHEAVVPFTIDSLVSGSTVYWFPGATGGSPSLTPVPPVSTATPGYFTVWATQKVGSCESPRGSGIYHVITKPAAPVVSGRLEYCQFIGPVTPLTATHTVSGILRWYTTATGGTFSLTQPTPNVNIAGSNNYWVSQYDSTCESDRTPVTVIIHPKPAPPVINPPHQICQFVPSAPMSATPSGSGDVLTWYGPGVTAGYPAAPTPVTDSVDVIRYYVTETSSFGCISDSAEDDMTIIIEPQPPVVRDVWYCQYFHPASYLNAQVDSQASSFLTWYYNSTVLPATPLPPTDTTPGNMTWWVSQTINTCKSDSVPVTVTIIYKPVFEIAARPWVCQFDSIMLSYSGPNLFAPGYMWTLPVGAHFAGQTHEYDSSIVVRFDSAILNNYVHLTASDDSGKCKTDTSIRIKIVKQPEMNPHCKPDVCLGDTVLLGLANESAEAYTFTWYIDNMLMKNSLALNVLAANSNSGGPFSISWIDSGRHIIKIESYSREGCRSEPSYDTINVHTLPDATFKVSPKTNPICLEDSVLFVANMQDYRCSYSWEPTHSFNNINKPVIWGRVENKHSVITLTVTDPFGCASRMNQEIDPDYCCTIWFPSAFSPNGDHRNDVFRPLCTGYHRFHMFRIVNRWGQTIYQSENSDAEWDGNYNGVPQDIGTYYYYLRYDCGGNGMEQKGDVTLIR